ncbi:hypothetical protein HYH03_017865 [Edaphochlamys debaryana]|uniref:Pherophorin domain-containing protein n=1 Tax=Edaphochlamys debaryana TaxID=47281 RepID=A0A836BNW7_9CHLO|nr:hypothetical protein HYH03_017865 [Edaphochlamys debaryana]|eukprot:KAG2483267.1 hypothetical protein HYH03_017865 [Edaphochlamys debaryana]
MVRQAALGLALVALAACAGLPTATAQAAVGDFPYCSCATYDCDCSPLKPALLSHGAVNATHTKTCFQIQNIGCDTSRSCCKRMMRSVDKLSFATTSECQKVNIARILWNNKRYVSWDTYEHVRRNGEKGYELKMYGLKSNAERLTGNKICIFTVRECKTIFQLCDGPGQLCRYSFADSPKTASCPTAPQPSTTQPAAPAAAQPTAAAAQSVAAFPSPSVAAPPTPSPFSSSPFPSSATSFTALPAYPPASA